MEIIRRNPHRARYIVSIKLQHCTVNNFHNILGTMVKILCSVQTSAAMSLVLGFPSGCGEGSLPVRKVRRDASHVGHAVLPEKTNTDGAAGGEGGSPGDGPSSSGENHQHW